MKRYLQAKAEPKFITEDWSEAGQSLQDFVVSVVFPKDLDVLDAHSIQRFFEVDLLDVEPSDKKNQQD